MITIGCVSLLLLSFVNSVASNCLLGGGCGSGLCCSAYGVCGAGAQYCGGVGGGLLYPGWSGSPYLGGDCRLGGCGGGSCCSPYGYCGNSAEYCGGGAVVVVQPVAVSNCGLTGCAAGSCCSSYGYCGNSGAYCGAVAYGNCGATACGAGLCCTRYGYCGNAGLYCALQKSAGDIQPASLEGDFQGQATYYNETKAGSQYSTCGIERGRSLNEDNEKIYGAALNQAQFDPYTVNGIPSTNPVCYKKALVKGPKGEIKVQFIDRCPDCNQGDLALTQEAFIAVAGELGNGQTNVEWHFI